MLCTHSFAERQQGERQIYRDRAWSIPTWKYSFITDLCLDHAISLVSQLRHNVKQVQLQPIITAVVIYLFASTICTCWCEMISNCTLTLSVSQVKMFNNKTKQDLFLLQLQDCLSPKKHIGTQAVKLKMKMWEESAKNLCDKITLGMYLSGCIKIGYFSFSAFGSSTWTEQILQVSTVLHKRPSPCIPICLLTMNSCILFSVGPLTFRWMNECSSGLSQTVMAAFITMIAPVTAPPPPPPTADMVSCFIHFLHVVIPAVVASLFQLFRLADWFRFSYSCYICMCVCVCVYLVYVHTFRCL